MKPNFYLFEEQGSRTVRTTYHDAEISKTKISGAVPILFRFPSEQFRRVWIKLNNPTQTNDPPTADDIVAYVDNLENIINPPQKYSDKELLEVLNGPQRGRITVLNEIRDLAEQKEQYRIASLATEAFSHAKIHDSIITELARFYKKEIQLS